MVRMPHLFATVLGFMLLAMLGCSPGHYKPVVKVTKGGQPLKLGEKALVNVVLYPEADSKFADSHAGSWNNDSSSFTVVGKTGTGVPAGKYKISFTIIDPYPTGKDMLDGKFAKENGPVVDIKSNAELTLDVEKK